MSNQADKADKKVARRRPEGEEPPEIECAFCGGVYSKSWGKTDWRRPNGWLILGGKDCCPACRRKNYVVRTVSLTVARIETTKVSGAEAWKSFRNDFRATERGVLRLKNWALSEYYASDPIRNIPYNSTSKTKLPKFDLRLYSDPRTKVVGAGCASAQRREALTDALQAYKKQRLDIFLGKCSLRTMKSPTPVPFGKSWQLHRDKTGNIYAGVNINGTRYKLFFAGGRRHARGQEAIKKMLEEGGDIIPASLTLHDLSAGNQQHRPLLKKGKRLVCKISGYFPKTKHRSALPNRTLYVFTGNDVLLRYGTNDNPTKRLTLNADHIRRVGLAHRRRLDRLAEDRKRYPRGSSDNAMINAKTSAVCEKHHRRIGDYLHKVSKMIVDFAVRNKCSKIELDDSKKGFIKEFPWYRLCLLIQQKSNQHNIEYTASAPVTLESQAPLASTLGS